MTYRKIIVNGQEYKYVVGRTHTKIKGIGVWLNDEIGIRVANHQYCECCGESLTDMYGDEPRAAVKVTPIRVARLIKIFA